MTNTRPWTLDLSVSRLTCHQIIPIQNRIFVLICSSSTVDLKFLYNSYLVTCLIRVTWCYLSDWTRWWRYHACCEMRFASLESLKQYMITPMFDHVEVSSSDIITARLISPETPNRAEAWQGVCAEMLVWILAVLFRTLEHGVSGLFVHMWICMSTCGSAMPGAAVPVSCESDVDQLRFAPLYCHYTIVSSPLQLRLPC